MRFFTLLLFLASASLVLATGLPNITAPTLPSNIPTENPIQLISELSPSCQAAFLSIITNPEFFQCVPVIALLPLITDPTLLPSVLKDPLQNAPKLLPMIDAICADPKCSDAGVASATQAVLTGCAADLKSPLVQIAIGVLTFYSPVRDIICLKDNKKEYCTVETITNVLSLPPPPKDFKLLGGIIDKLLVAEPKFICTPCNKAMINILINFLKKNPAALLILEQGFHIGQLEEFLVKFYFFTKCGFQFLDGKVPDPSKIDPSKFTYQQVDSNEKASLANRNDLNLIMLGSLLASSLVLN